MDEQARRVLGSAAPERRARVVAESMDTFRALAVVGARRRADGAGRAARDHGEAQRRRARVRAALRPVLLGPRATIIKRSRRRTAGRARDERGGVPEVPRGARATPRRSRASSCRQLARRCSAHDAGALERMLREAAEQAGLADIEHGVPGGALRARRREQRSGVGGARATSSAQLQAAARRGRTPADAPAQLEALHRPAAAGPRAR